MISKVNLTYLCSIILFPFSLRHEKFLNCGLCNAQSSIRATGLPSFAFNRSASWSTLDFGLFNFPWWGDSISTILELEFNRNFVYVIFGGLLDWHQIMICVYSAASWNWCTFGRGLCLSSREGTADTESLFRCDENQVFFHSNRGADFDGLIPSQWGAWFIASTKCLITTSCMCITASVMGNIGWAF